MNTIKTIIPKTNGFIAKMAAKIEKPEDLDEIPDFLLAKNQPKTPAPVVAHPIPAPSPVKTPPVAPAKKAMVAKASPKKPATEARKPEKQASEPKAKASKSKEKAPKTPSIGGTAMSAILAGKSNEDALAVVMKAHPACSSNLGCMNWYRNKLRKEGKLKDGSAKRPTKGKDE